MFHIHTTDKPLRAYMRRSAKLLFHNVFYPFGELFTILIEFTFIVCRLSEFGGVQNLSFRKGLISFQICDNVNSFLTDDDTGSFCWQCRSRSDCTECAVWSLIYTVRIFILYYNLAVSSSCSGSVFLANEKAQFIYSALKELILSSENA